MLLQELQTIFIVENILQIVRCLTKKVQKDESILDTAFWW